MISSSRRCLRTWDAVEHEAHYKMHYFFNFKDIKQNSATLKKGLWNFCRNALSTVSWFYWSTCWCFVDIHSWAWPFSYLLSPSEPLSVSWFLYLFQPWSSWLHRGKFTCTFVQSKIEEHRILSHNGFLTAQSLIRKAVIPSCSSFSPL